MDEHKFTELLRSESLEVPGKTRFCPDEEQIAGYFEGALDERSHATLKRHLADCRHCLARVGNLERLAQEPWGHGIPGEALAEAKGYATPASTPRTRFTPAWAAAATVVLAVLAVSLLQTGGDQHPVTPSPALQTAPNDERQVRNAEPLSARPSIISPVDGASIDPNDLSIRWTGVRGSLYYDVRVVDDEGFIVQSERIEGATEWKPPVSHLLEPGMSYYVRVDAYMAETDTVSSDHVLITVGEGRR